MRCADRTSTQPASRILTFTSVFPFVVALFLIVSIAWAPAAHAIDRKRALNCDVKAKQAGGCGPPLIPHFVAAQSTVPTVNSLYYPYRVAVDFNGDVYISNTSASNVLKETFSQGVYSETVIGSGLVSPYGVAVDSSQNVYIADNGNNRVLKETFSAGAYTQSVLTTSSLYYPTGIATDASGNVYICDTGNERILKESPSGSGYTETVVDSGFPQIVGITVDSSGDLFVSDIDSMTIYEETYSAGTYTQSTVPTSGLYYPYDIAVDSHGNLYISDFANYRIVKLTNLDGSYTQSVFPVVNLNGVLGLAVDARGDLYLADSFGFNIKEEAVNGGNFGPVPPLAGAIYAIFQFAGGFGSETISLGAINIDTQGRQSLDYFDGGSSTCSTSTSYQAGDSCAVSVVFIPTAAGARNGAVQLLDGSLNLLASAYLTGTGLGAQVGFSPPSLNTLVSGLNQPFGISFDGYGNLFEADYGSGNVKEFYAESGYTESANITLVTEVAGMAVDGAGNIFFSGFSNGNVYESMAASGYATSNIVASGFTFPFGVAVDGSGNLFVADRNNAVYEIPLSGGRYGAQVAIGSGFSDPFGLALDVDGNLYVADHGNNAVKEILQAGGYTTVNTLASVTGVESVAVDANGNVYVADDGDGSANTVAEILAVDGVIPDSPTIDTLTTDSNGPEIVALDSLGNVYYGTSEGPTIVKLDYSDAPTLSFASTAVGSTSSDSPKTVTVENLGNQPLIFPVPGSGTNASVSSSFTLGNSTTCPVITTSGSSATLPANATCVYAIGFAPAATGSLSGSVTLTDNALNGNDGTQSIQLSGVGTAALAPAVGLAPAMLAFGSQTVGVASSSQAVVLTNTGTANLSLTAIAITGTNSADFAPTSNCGATLASTAQCTVNVTFTPSLTGAESAALQFTDNAAGSPQAVALTGTGVVTVTPGYSIAASPTALSIAQGQSASTTLTVTPVGGMTGTLAFSCTGLPAHADCVFAPTQVVMTGNNVPASVTLTVNTAAANGVIAQAQPSQLNASPDWPSLASLGLLPSDSLRSSSLQTGSLQTSSLRAIALLIMPAGLVLCLIPGLATKNRRKRSPSVLLWMGVLLIGALTTIGMTGCSGVSKGSLATPVGQYSVRAVAAVGSANGQSAVVTITITQ